ncbi:hypothetical protein FACS189481_2360 [Clostridia bacterium]|nr:hypothetical protein FACS189481_2360 [Clostridia bacterium]
MRNFEENDLPAFAKFLEPDGFTDACWTTFYQPKLDHFRKNCFLVFEEKTGKLVGTCVYYKAYGKEYGGEFPTIQCLAVDENHRRKGIGKALCAKCMAQVSKKAYPIYLTTHVKSAPAIGMYLKDFNFHFVTHDFDGPNKKRPWGSNLSLGKATIQESLKVINPEALKKWQEREIASPLFTQILEKCDKTEL